MPEPIPVTLSATAEEKLKRYLRDKVRSIREGLRPFHETTLPRWRKAYEAVPAEKVRELPWHGASNIVIPIIAIHSDTLLARVMSAVIKVRPFWKAKLVGEFDKRVEEVRLAHEEYMSYVGLEPDELDLYRVYHEWFGSTIREGTGIVKTPWVKKLEDSIIPSGDGLGGFDFDRGTLYDGPRPEKLPLEDFGIDPHEKTVESANFKYHVVHLERFDLEERGFRKVYDPAKVKEILKSPDRTARRAAQQLMESEIGASTSSGYGFAEWDIYECHFRYKLASKYVRLLAWYHEKTDTLLRCFYHYYPGENFVGARLFFRDDMFFGYGFCEILWPFQEEISEIHNDRRNNATVRNAALLRADPDSPLHKGFQIFPGAVLPGRKDELEAINFGLPTAQTEIAEEQLSLELAERRSGVSPPQQGFGAGTVNKKGGYSAMGTMSLMQEGNSRTDLNVTDIRYAHTKLGRILQRQYAEFGISERAKLFGRMAQKINLSFQLVRSGMLALPITAATASVNREVEKQNDIMLSGAMQKHHAMVMQALQAAENPMLQGRIKQYSEAVAESATKLMRLIMKHFDYDEIEQLVPEPGQPGPAPGAAPGGMGRPTSQQAPGGMATGAPAAGPPQAPPGGMLPMGLPGPGSPGGIQ